MVTLLLWAYARLMSAFQDETTDKDKVASQANAFIMKADSLNPNNSGNILPKISVCHTGVDCASDDTLPNIRHGG